MEAERAAILVMGGVDARRVEGEVEGVDDVDGVRLIGYMSDVVGGFSTASVIRDRLTRIHQHWDNQRRDM